MPNKARPRCPDCESAMEPVYRKSQRGASMVRVPNVFWCEDDSVIARGRRKGSVKYAR